MKTLYEQFIECKQAHNNSVKNNTLIVQQLVELFYRSYGIDLSATPNCFFNHVGTIGEELSLSYKFEYGEVNVSTFKKRMQVIFFHKDHVKAPFHANRCTVDVDHNLNFISANYCIYFSFSNRALKSNGVGYNQMKINRVIDSKGAYNSLAFRHSDSLDDNLFLDVEQGKLDKRFLTPNVNLEKEFYRFIDFITEYPQDFNTLFTGYPRFSECVAQSDSIVDLVNTFVHQYYTDNTKLMQTLLLTDMIKQ